MTSFADPVIRWEVDRLDPSRVAAYADFAVRTRSPLARRVLQDAGHDAEVGRVIALSGAPDSHARGLAAIDAAVSRSGPGSLPAGTLAIWAGLLLRAGRDADLRAVLDDPTLELPEVDRWALRTDLLNPYRHGRRRPDGGAAPDPARWLEAFNEVHNRDGLEPVTLSPEPDGSDPYPLLRAHATSQVDGDLVTVVMSAYQPGPDLLMAVRGVLDQSWRNLELLVVDDASPAGTADLLEEAEAMDPRVRVVRAPRNGGTYVARNLALAVASGRWLTFQDSDDWTHPRRIEHQVQNLLDNPGVLANRTWALRAYPDLTLTFVGYSSMRLNASSLLFDRAEVRALLTGFDSIRKSGDMELPLRLKAVRPGSVRDMERPGPLAITQLRPGSLSRDDALPGWTRWDRLAYRDSYLEWHRQIAVGRSGAHLPAAKGRSFPLPRASWLPDRPAEPRQHWDVVVLGDVRPSASSGVRTLGIARTCAQAGLETAVAHAETTAPLSSKREKLVSDLSTDVRTGLLHLTNPHEDDRCDLLVVTEPRSLLHLDEAALRPRAVLVVADESAPLGWDVPTVERRCAELFGLAPRWGGPRAVHDDPSGISKVRRDVPMQRWVDADLALVAGAGRMQVGAQGRGRPLRSHLAGAPYLAVGHHLPDDARRWPSTPEDLRAAYPDEVRLDRGGCSEAQPSSLPVEVHCLRRMTTPAKILGGPSRPVPWSSFAGTGMTVREYLSHLDVWVYLGEWDTVAELAALDALDAGLPCVLGEGAARSGLEGPVRCVAPTDVPAAVAELVGGEAISTGTPRRRHDAWSTMLHALVRDAREGAPLDPDHPHPDPYERRGTRP